MKILFTVQHYYPLMSGVPVVVRYLAEGLQRKGHTVSIVTTWVEGSPQKENLEGVNIYRFRVYHNKIKGYYGEIEKYIEFVNSFPSDIIINECTQCETTDVLLKHIGKLKPPIILHSHGFSGLTLKPVCKLSTIKHTFGNTFNWVRWRYYYLSFSKYMVQYDKLLCLSEVDSGKAYMEKFAESKVMVLENAANQMFFEEKTKESALSKYTNYSGGDYLISVANYTAVKNQKMILEAFYQMKFTDCELVFVGSQKTSFYNKLNKYKIKLDIKYGFRTVHFLTGIERKNIPSLIEHAKVYLVSSTLEAYSISIIEAMARAVPFISTNVGNACILPGGIIINSSYEMSKEIDELFENELKRCNLGLKGQKYAREHCTEAVAIEKMEQVLLTVIK